MADNKIIRDTLFIDMKYIILYRKLGYKEIKLDVFSYEYPDTTIIIESEHQLFNFHNRKYPLKNYKDFVLLECIDRLFKKGYKSTDIVIGDGGFDIRVVENNRILFNVLVSGWDDYKKLLSSYKHGEYKHGIFNLETKDLESIIVLYTSQLSGGLVDYISTIYQGDEIYHEGIFEKQSNLKDFNLNKQLSANIYPNDFEYQNDTLKKYIGSKGLVKIPFGTKRIDTGAFWNATYLEEVVIPDTVTCIAGDSFIYCTNLKKINIPKNVDQIGDNPFAGAENLIIENHSPNFIIEDEVLFDKDRTILIHYIPQNPRTQYTIPETVQWIGKHSFYNCKNLELVIITKNVRFMGNNVFSDCPKIVLQNESPYFVYEKGGLYNSAKTEIFHYSMGIDNKVFEIPNGVRKIGRNSFWNCNKLEKIILPPSIREIGYNPFASCTNLEFENHSDRFSVVNGLLLDHDEKQLICCTSKVAQQKVILPSTLINIGRNSFTGCESLKDLVIPEGVQQISRGAFSNCINLERIHIPQSITRIEAWAFSGCKKLKQIRIRKDTVIIPTALNNCGAVVTYYE